MNDANNAGTNHIWFDTEFIEDGTTIDLISIGLVRSDGATYYAETDQWIPGKASQWVKDNVIVHLRGGDAIKPRDVIAREIVEFAGETPEFWAYYADYDWVALCQLYGTMMQLPEGWPMFCRDVKQLCVDIGNPKLPEQMTTEHHALADAQWTKLAWEHCRALSTPTEREVITRVLKDNLRITLIEEFGEISSARITEENMATMADAVLAVRLDEAAIRKDEREKCAKICKDYAQWAESKIDSETSIFGTVSNTADDLAEMILSRRQADMKRITDLEKFALDDIWRPYQNMAGYNTRLESIPVSLEATADFLMSNTEWSRCVLNRIADIGVVFPSYINHPIVDVIQRATESKSSDRGKQP